MSKTVKPRRLGGDLYLVPGSPASIIKLIDGAERAVVVDPGIGENRGAAILQALEGLIGNSDVKASIVLTHGHTDHLAAAADIVAENGWPVYAPRHCVALVEDSRVRRAVVYGGLVSEELASMPMVELRVDYWYTRGPVPGFEAVPLPGHSPGHTGLLDEEAEVFVVGDALFGERVLSSYGIPFALDLRLFAETIKEKIVELAKAGYKLVPGHGPVAEGRRAEQLIKANIELVERLRAKTLELICEKPYSMEKLTITLTRTFSSLGEVTPRQLLLNRTAVSSLLAWLQEEGKAEPITTNEAIEWRCNK